MDLELLGRPAAGTGGGGSQAGSMLSQLRVWNAENPACLCVGSLADSWLATAVRMLGPAAKPGRCPRGVVGFPQIHGPDGSACPYLSTHGGARYSVVGSGDDVLFFLLMKCAELCNKIIC